MKKISYFLLFIMTLWSLCSCVHNEEDLFSSSASERLTAAVDEYNKVLTAAPNGWLIEYFAGKPEAKLGGYNYICSFNPNGTVTVTTELEIGDHEVGDKVTSLYRLIHNQSVVLTFDTYNELFHFFSEPKGSSDIDGYQGDYEFVFYKVTPEEIILKGKKYGITIRMTPVKSDQNWKEYFDAVLETEEDSFAPGFTFWVNNKEEGSLSLIDRIFTLKYKLGEEDTTFKESLIFTSDGFKLYAPISIANGVAVQHFKWNAASSIFECTDPATNIVLKKFYPEGYISYDKYLGEYVFEYLSSGTSRTVVGTVKALSKNSSYLVSGMMDFDFILDYDKTVGNVRIYPQVVGQNGANDVFLCVWDPKAGYLSWSSTLWYQGRVSSTTPFQIQFVDSKVWTYPITALLLYEFNSSGSAVGTYGKGIARFQDVSMKKK